MLETNTILSKMETLRKGMEIENSTPKIALIATY